MGEGESTQTQPGRIFVHYVPLMSALLSSCFVSTFPTEGGGWRSSLLRAVFFSMINSSFYSFNKDFFSTYYVPGSVLVVGDVKISGPDQCLFQWGK